MKKEITAIHLDSMKTDHVFCSIWIGRGRNNIRRYRSRNKSRYFRALEMQKAFMLRDLEKENKS